MNKWKVGFYTLLLLLLSSVVFGYYKIIDQATSISYMEEGYSNTEKDLNMLIQILNKRSFSYDSIKESVTENGYLVKDNEVISLNRLSLEFRNNTLYEVVDK